ncbi:MAG: septum formation inhibitor Maf [Gemmatimonadales bacterium]|nr:MAG: septum formation inhibitor Maf [Gemmatimonadales bacterium]
MPRIVLASGSPRRREVLTALGLPFTVRRPELEETMVSGEFAESAVRRLAEEKAACVSVEPGELVLAADTVVVLDGDFLGKPADDREAIAMLMRLSGRSHDVFTGLALLVDGRSVSAATRTEVTFRQFDRLECEAYVATGEPLDKAGAYGIQGFGSALVERIHGDFFNVMGLPVPTFLRLLTSVGYRYSYGCIVRHPPDEEQ